MGGPVFVDRFPIKMSAMQVAIITPAPTGSTTGNGVTALRWASLLDQLGHRAIVEQFWSAITNPAEINCLIALHARRSAPSIIEYRQRFPDRPIVVCLTGTDLHQDLSDSSTSFHSVVRHSLELANRIVMLEPNSARLLDSAFRSKVHVIFQSATRLNNIPEKPVDCFSVVVVGHLRDVKDPFRAEAASRLLPDQSRIQVTQVGTAELQPDLAGFATRLEKENARYRWIGPKNHEQAMRILASSHLLVVSSRLEGAPNVLSEAIVNKVPALVTRIDASLGMLGADYPGLFGVGDTQELARLMWQAETGPAFCRKILEFYSKIEHRYRIETERAELKKLLDSCCENG